MLRTISLMGQAEAGIKGPKKRGPGHTLKRGTPAFFEERLMEDTQESHVFHGNAKEAISLLPTKVNVAVASSLATWVRRIPVWIYTAFRAWLGMTIRLHPR